MVSSFFKDVKYYDTFVGLKLGLLHFSIKRHIFKCNKFGITSKVTHLKVTFCSMFAEKIMYHKKCVTFNVLQETTPYFLPTYGYLLEVTLSNMGFVMFLDDQ